MWSDKWIGVPYEEFGRGPKSYDCLGFFMELQKERFGRVLNFPACSMSEAARADLAGSQREKWRPVQMAREGCAVLWKVRGHALHVGYALDARWMLHMSGEVGESMIEDFTSANWGQRLEGIYEYGG